MLSREYHELMPFYNRGTIRLCCLSYSQYHCIVCVCVWSCLQYLCNSIHLQMCSNVKNDDERALNLHIWGGKRNLFKCGQENL